MTLSDIGWFSIIPIGYVALTIWGNRGKNYGYIALASRTQELLQKGTAEVYLLFSPVGAEGYPGAQGRFISDWEFVKTGYLAYVDNGELVIEFPWWNNMKVLGKLNPKENKLKYTRILKPTPDALWMGNREYLAAGINITSPQEAKSELDIQKNKRLDEYQARFIAELTGIGFNIM